MRREEKRTALAYGGIISVILIWAVIPIFKKFFIGDYFSASVYSAISAFSSFFALLIINRKALSSLNREYFKVAVPTGLCVGAAVLAQALAYNFNASPTNQAFLENLSCLIVPVILFVMTKRKPSALTVIASIVCLTSSMVLSGIFSVGARFSAADILNVLAGIFYGVNIAFTGIYAKKFKAALYVMIQLFVQGVLSAIMAVAFNFIQIGGSVIDPFVFTPNILTILGVMVIGVISNALCWTVRTSAMKHVSASVVAIIMPFSAVITAVIAVLSGQDRATPSLLIGAGLGIAAGLISALGDIKERESRG